MTHARLLLAAAAMSTIVTAAHGQPYPSKPIRVIIPFQPGGATDVPGRILMEKVSEGLRAPVLVDNRPGASSTIGAGLVASAPADGYTLLLTSITHLLSAHLYKTPYHAVNDFTPVMEFSVAPSVLVVHPSLPARSVRELIALAKARPDEIDYASSGSGGTLHVFCELFQLMSATKMRHIPYQRGDPWADLVSGRVQVAIPGMARVLPHIQAGRLRGLGTTGARRARSLPEMPTVAEAGIKGYDAELWNGVMAPKGTPSDIVGRLHAEMSKVLKLPEVEKRLAAAGNDVVVTDPAQFGAFMKSEFAKWGRVIKEANIKSE
jgi:tripartite-type tricarboxylate transporter receptor subunit TctC